VIPPDESAIRALAVAPDGKLYGATSGARAHLFVLEPQHGYIVPLGFLPDKTVHHSLAVDANGNVFIGTALAVDNNGEGYAAYAGGHLLRYVPNRERPDIKVDAACAVEDLGIPVKGQGIYALTIDRARGVVYGLTYPDGVFFSISAGNGAVKTHGSVASGKIPGEKFENEKNIGRALIVANDGDVYTSGSGKLVRFDVKTQKLETLNVPVATVPGREVYNRVDAWTKDEAGSLYGGTSDGYLFRFDPERRRMENLGKPLNQYRIRGLVTTAAGKLYGIGGDTDEMARLFSYDPARGVYEMLGMIDVNRRPYYSWQGYVFDSMAIGADGTVYMGQAERKSKLYLFYPN
jgi:streptogramin lyase